MAETVLMQEFSSTTAERARLIVSATFGSVMEWYDFFIFSTSAVLVFGKTFFPTTDNYSGILLGLSVYAVGFFARPFGGIVFGALGDRVGRKRMLVISMFLMGSATVLIGLIPDYATIGIWAPIALVVLRVAQGIAVGGEATGALLIVAELMPAQQRGFWVSFPMIGGPAGNVIAALVIGWLQAYYGNEAFTQWGWRITFIASIILVGVGLWSRLKLQESPAFKEALARGEALSKAPLREALRDFRWPMTQVFLVKTAENTLFYLFTTFFLVLATGYLGHSRGVALSALFWGSCFEVAIIVLAGHIADRIGRRPVILTGLVGGMTAGCVLFTLDPTASPLQLTTAISLALLFHGITVGGMSAFFTEVFPTRVRFTAMSTGYTVASVVGGSLAPIVGTVILEKTGAPLFVAVYVVLSVIPAVVCTVVSQETKGSNLVD